jgi:hypothetical protein
VIEIEELKVQYGVSRFNGFFGDGFRRKQGVAFPGFSTVGTRKSFSEEQANTSSTTVHARAGRKINVNNSIILKSHRKWRALVTSSGRNFSLIAEDD